MFLLCVSSGVDIPSLLKTLHISESIISSVKDSSMGHLAIAFMCYKLAGPLRYMVTIGKNPLFQLDSHKNRSHTCAFFLVPISNAGGTTVSVKYLSQLGYIKPMPSKERLKQMYDEKKAKFKKLND